jgi:hypothetical protein
MKKYLNLIIVLIIAAAYIGCNEEDPVNPPPDPPVDTNVVNFNNQIINERTIPFDSALSAVDLVRGLIVRDGDPMKDANLIDSIALGDSVYYFRSGELSDFPVSVPGYQTKFRLIHLNLTQSEFDTMKTIPDFDTVLTENDFPDDNTQSFSAPLLFHNVYGFYLKGKYDNNITPYQVFGLLYLDSSFDTPSGFQLVFDVKINKGGKNNFKSQ